MAGHADVSLLGCHATGIDDLRHSVTCPQVRAFIARRRMPPPRWLHQGAMPVACCILPPRLRLVELCSSSLHILCSAVSSACRGDHFLTLLASAPAATRSLVARPPRTCRLVFEGKSARWPPGGEAISSPLLHLSSCLSSVPSPFCALGCVILIQILQPPSGVTRLPKRANQGRPAGRVPHSGA